MFEDNLIRSKFNIFLATAVDWVEFLPCLSADCFFSSVIKNFDVCDESFDDLKVAHFFQTIK